MILWVFILIYLVLIAMVVFWEIMYFIENEKHNK